MSFDAMVERLDEKSVTITESQHGVITDDANQFALAPSEVAFDNQQGVPNVSTYKEPVTNMYTAYVSAEEGDIGFTSVAAESDLPDDHAPLPTFFMEENISTAAYVVDHPLAGLVAAERVFISADTAQFNGVSPLCVRPDHGVLCVAPAYLPASLQVRLERGCSGLEIEPVEGKGDEPDR